MEEDPPKTTPRKICTARFTISPTADFLHALALKRMNNISPLLEKLSMLEGKTEPEPEPPVYTRAIPYGTGPTWLPPLSQTPASLICKKEFDHDEKGRLMVKLDQDIKKVLGKE